MQIDELRRALNGYKAWLGIFGELQLASPGVACEGRSCGTRTQLLGLKASAALLCTYHTSQWCVDSYKASDLETCRPLSAECIEFVRSPTSCLLAVACRGTCTGVHVQRSTRWRLFSAAPLSCPAAPSWLWMLWPRRRSAFMSFYGLTVLLSRLSDIGWNPTKVSAKRWAEHSMPCSRPALAGYVCLIQVSTAKACSSALVTGCSPVALDALVYTYSR